MIDKKINGIRSNTNANKAAGLSVTRKNYAAQTTNLVHSIEQEVIGHTGSVQVISGAARVLSVRETQRPAVHLLLKKGLACPVRNSETTLCRGRYGEFFGCTKYPVRKGIIQKNRVPREKFIIILSLTFWRLQKPLVFNLQRSGSLAIFRKVSFELITMKFFVSRLETLPSTANMISFRH